MIRFSDPAVALFKLAFVFVACKTDTRAFVGGSVSFSAQPIASTVATSMGEAHDTFMRFAGSLLEDPRR
jgi:hypothetical protein